MKKCIPLSIRKRLYIKARGRCENCNTNKKLDVHHIIPRKQGGCNSIHNLRLFCKDCHNNLGISNRMVEGRFKTLNIYFSDMEFLFLSRDKGDRTWHNYMLDKIGGATS